VSGDRLILSVPGIIANLVVSFDYKIDVAEYRYEFKISQLL
jgi:hypothetical protein